MNSSSEKDLSVRAEIWEVHHGKPEHQQEHPLRADCVEPLLRQPRGLAGGLSPKLAEAVLLYNQTVTQPLGFPKAVVTSRPNSDVSDNIQEPTETNCLDFEGVSGGLWATWLE